MTFFSRVFSPSFRVNIPFSSKFITITDLVKKNTRGVSATPPPGRDFSGGNSRSPRQPGTGGAMDEQLQRQGETAIMITKGAAPILRTLIKGH